MVEIVLTNKNRSREVLTFPNSPTVTFQTKEISIITYVSVDGVPCFPNSGLTALEQSMLLSNVNIDSIDSNEFRRDGDVVTLDFTNAVNLLTRSQVGVSAGEEEENDEIVVNVDSQDILASCLKASGINGVAIHDSDDLPVNDVFPFYGVFYFSSDTVFENSVGELILAKAGLPFPIFEAGMILRTKINSVVGKSN